MGTKETEQWHLLREGTWGLGHGLEATSHCIAFCSFDFRTYRYIINFLK